MIDNNNILLITNNEDLARTVTRKLVLLRKNDNITTCNTINYKKVITNSLYCVVILHETDNSEDTLKLITSIKELKPEVEILLILNNSNPQLILKAYDIGIYDYFLSDTEAYEIMIKTINCFKMGLLREQKSRHEKFLYQLGAIDNKTNFYQYKHLKDIFLELSENSRIKNGYFIVMTLNETIKTKVSTNRLGLAIKNSIRADDIVAIGKSGKFYIILPNIDILGTKNLILKIQNKMGETFRIHAGIAKIGINSFETLDKNANDSLTSAIQNDIITVHLENNIDIQNSWLDDEQTIPQKHDFKLFNIAFTKKMNNIITPTFYRYQKEYENKLTNTFVSQYSNNIESVFCIKNKDVQSELIIRYNGFAKFNIEINHSGLDSEENSKFEIQLNKMTEKYLTSLLKQLKDEYMLSTKNIKEKIKC